MSQLKRQTDDFVKNLTTYIYNCIRQGPCTCCSFTDVAVNRHCNALHEIGVILLTDERLTEHEAAEEFLTTVLQRPDFQSNFKSIALFFLKHQKAFICNRTKRIIVAFEADPQNTEIIDGTRKLLNRQ